MNAVGAQTAIPIQVYPADRWDRRDWVALSVLLLVTLGLYLRAATFSFINLDDAAYVYSNYQITTGFSAANFEAAMTSTINGNWHPLTTLAWLAIASIFGVHAGTFHLIDSILHAINAALLFGFLRRATGRYWPSVFVAFLWSLHPQRVESVTWVSELKDVLCGLFWLLCMLAYVHYSQSRTIGRYLLVVLFLVAALLAKPMAVTLPMVLLLLDCWPITATKTGRWWLERIAEKLPLLMICAADVAVGLAAQFRSHSNIPLNIFPMRIRMENAVVSYGAYLRDMFWPAHLSVFYPHPAIASGATLSIFSLLAAAMVLITVSILVCIDVRPRPYLFVGWFWFCGTLFPVSGLLQSGQQARADRFTYFPAMGLTIAIVWCAADVIRRWPKWSGAVTGLGVTASIALALVSNRYIGYWKDGTTLFTHLIQIQPDNYFVIGMLGDDLRAKGHNEQALVYGARAVTIAPGDPGVRIFYAIQLRTAKRYDDAAQQLSDVLAGDSRNFQALNMLGIVRGLQAGNALAAHLPTEQKFRRQSIHDFSQALKIKPDDVEAGESLAYELAAIGRLDDAIAVWSKVVSLMPTFGQAQGDLADALRLKQDLPGAIAHYQAALASGNKTPAWESELSYLVATNPHSLVAEVQPLVGVAKDACDQTQNRNVEALDAYAACLARVGRFDDAVAAVQQAVAQAYADHTPLIAEDIQKRLLRYQRGLPYVAGEQ